MFKIFNLLSRIITQYSRLILIFFLGFSLTFSPVIISAQTIISPEILAQQADILYQKGQVIEAAIKLEKAITLFQNNPQLNTQKLAITATNLCRLQIELGEANKAIKTCDLAIINYQKTNHILGIKRSQLYQTYALQQIGFNPLACQKVIQILNINEDNCQALTKQNIDDNLKLIDTENIITIEAWRTLGEILRNMGQFSLSKTILEQLLEPLDQNSNLSSKISLSLGNIYQALGDLERERITVPKYSYIPWQHQPLILPKSAKKYYQKADTAYKNASQSLVLQTQIKTTLNRIQLFLLNNDPQSAKRLHDELNLSQLPLTQFRIHAKIQYTKQKHWIDSFYDKNNSSQIIQLLEESIAESEQIKSEDNQALISQSKGNLGSFYEYLSFNNNEKKLRQKAKNLTQQALYLAQPKNNPYLAYQWQWQLARINQVEGNLNQAIEDYESAITTLETVRKNILIIKPDIQFSFRDNIEPLYREYINSLLESHQKIPNPEKLKKILTQVESLQLAELENFLQCDLSSQITFEKITDTQSLIIYPILLKEKLVIIYQVPGINDYIDYQEVQISNQEVNQTLKKLQGYLGEIGNGCKKCEIPRESQKVYQWIIKPLETILTENQSIDTLVFVLDGLLRNIPMSVLYDGEKQEYLLEKKYGIAVAPGLTLLQAQSSISPPIVFLGGVNLEQTFQDNLSFDSIQYLQEELENIAKIVPTNIPLLNQEFTRFNLEKELQGNQYSAIHWKTHGVFSSNPEQTYIVAYKELIKPNDINQLIQTGSQEKTNPIDLLVLSACETAKGDNRAVLGLAGIAVRAGVSSTVSTLWRADDKANTQLMTDFYQALAKPNMTKAKALHEAQLSLFKANLEYKDPHYWSSYILVGNWK